MVPFNIRHDVCPSVTLVNTDIKFTDKLKARESLITRMRLGHCWLNHYLFKINRHPTGLCDICQQPETVSHYLLSCTTSNVCKTVLETCRLHNIDTNLKSILSNKTATDAIYEAYKLGQRKLQKFQTSLRWTAVTDRNNIDFRLYRRAGRKGSRF